MGLGEQLLATGRVLLDAPQLLEQLRDLADDQRELLVQFTAAATELRGDVRRLSERDQELRGAVTGLRNDVDALRVAVANAPESSEVGAIRERLAALESNVKGLDSFIDRSIALSGALSARAALGPPRQPQLPDPR